MHRAVIMVEPDMSSVRVQLIGKTFVLQAAWNEFVWLFSICLLMPNPRSLFCPAAAFTRPLGVLVDDTPAPVVPTPAPIEGTSDGFADRRREGIKPTPCPREV